MCVCVCVHIHILYIQTHRSELVSKARHRGHRVEVQILLLGRLLVLLGDHTLLR